MTHPTHDPVLTFAQVELGGLRFGLATEHVVQALARPASLSRLPRSHGALDGVFNNRGQVVPVVDLRKWMADAPPASHTTPPPHVMVLGAQGRVVGVAVDAVRGLLRVRASRIHAVHHDNGTESFFHSVALPDDDSEPVSLLDPLRLMEQAQAWANQTPTEMGPSTVNSAEHENQVPDAGGTKGAPGQTPPQALLRVGDKVVAVDAAHVGEVVPALPVQRLFGRDNQLSGMVRWRGRDLPLLNIQLALGLATQASKSGPPLMLVLLWNERGMALPVDEVVALRSFNRTDIQATAPTGEQQAHLFIGTVLLGDGARRAHLLDTERLLGMCTMSTLAAQSHSVDHVQSASTLSSHTLALPGPGADIQQEERQGHIVFDAGTLWAAPMGALLEITHLPQELPLQSANSLGVVGKLEWRGRSIPILDVRQRGGLSNEESSETSAQPKLIVVQSDGMEAGLIVNDVVALLPAHVGVHTRLHMAGGELMHLLTVGDSQGQRKSYRVMAVGDLPLFAARAATGDAS